MKTHVTLQERLKDLRIEKGLSQEDLAEATGLSSSTISEYETDETKGIPHYALVQLADFYDVSLDYLFDRNSSRTNDTKDISELDLDDRTIEILKNKELNNRLLCELISHPGFKDVLADIEIYIDGIAGQDFQAIQAVMNAHHEMIVKKLKPDRDDIFAALLEANHVEERNYFINRIDTELSPILDDLREAHKKDTETATDTTLKDFILGNIHVPEITEEDPDEDVAQIFFKSFCSTSGINPSTVPPEEYNVFKKLMHRSKKYKDMLKTKKNSRKVKRLKERKEKNSES
ncbi:helix-turn-helix domain-containing protein [Pseudobutyrivibrio sp.]|uniref:helix-turn-helix domain-containing protein n=1 Tax=Pseudobutyrivibrio sp. TaxID=2014367 RepID=UPI0025E30BEE|nr:helix-turn-helix transcriptional regulator [Pseudobutyrivibrio sp.]MBR5650073.1 helix-turn-helix transcriptional regulator [Pseudobutyrivibrio sp.]